jgi:hypothetical protein
MAWLRWQQFKADSAERRAIQRYVERRDTYRVMCDVIVDAQRSADAYSRLELALQHNAATQLSTHV